MPGSKLFEKVLVGVDGSPHGQDAIALAVRLMDPGGALTLVHVHGGKDSAASTELLESARAEAGVSAEIVSVAAGNPGRGMHEAADEHAADLLVVGSSRRGGLRRVMLGDDTRAALNGSPCAVAVAASGFAAAPVPIARVGLGYNESAEADAALEVARLLAARTGGSVRALDVVWLPSYSMTGTVTPTLGVDIDELVTEAADRVGGLEGVEGSAAYGIPGEELAAFSADQDLLIVGSRSYGPVKRLVLGSTSDHLARRARCSLLVLPRETA